MRLLLRAVRPPQQAVGAVAARLSPARPQSPGESTRVHATCTGAVPRERVTPVLIDVSLLAVPHREGSEPEEVTLVMTSKDHIEENTSREVRAGSNVSATVFRRQCQVLNTFFLMSLLLAGPGGQARA